MMRVRCPICKAEAEIDENRKAIVIYLPPLNLPVTSAPFKPPVSTCFPSHADCELAKPVDKINLDKLVKLSGDEK